jgi:hypothetical protein
MKEDAPGCLVMIIRLTRLPDIDSDRQLQQTGYVFYGRFAVLLENSFWYGSLSTSHPAVTKTGWYWATTRADELLVSARGSKLDGEALFHEHKPVLALLVEELVKRGITRKPVAITLEGI